MTLDHELRQRFSWVFTVAQVKQLILGADFLSAYNLLVDVNEKKVDRHTCLQVNGSAVGCKIYGVYVLKPTNNVFFDVLAECDSISEANYRHQRISHDIRY